MSVTVDLLENHWMPFTANRHFKSDPRLLVRAEGVYYWNHHGQRLLDGISGLFCTPAGHGRPEIVEAVSAQLAEMDYGPHFQFGHPASFELAGELAGITPANLNHIFFANSGSEAVDTALKISLAYHAIRGQGQRVRLVGRERGYHGVNFGGVAVGGMAKNKELFGLSLPGVVHLRHTWLEENRLVPGQGPTGVELADDLQRLVDLYGGDTIAACIVEPIAVSTGVLVPPQGYLSRLREICDRHGILLIFDEVITGFGRTGEAFGSQSFEVVPDLITMAKALTNGCIPMGAVAVRDDIYRAFLDASSGDTIELFHGYTYSGHPAAAAAGLTAQKIYREDAIFERGAELSPHFLETVFSLQDLPVVTDIRGYGLLAGIDLACDDVPGKRGYRALQRCFESGLLVRVTGDSLILAPPLVADREFVDQACEILRGVLINL